MGLGEARSNHFKDKILVLGRTEQLSASTKHILIQIFFLQIDSLPVREKNIPELLNVR